MSHLSVFSQLFKKMFYIAVCQVKAMLLIIIAVLELANLHCKNELLLSSFWLFPWTPAQIGVISTYDKFGLTQRTYTLPRHRL